jgi:small subunit ribosomal protein S11
MKDLSSILKASVFEQNAASRRAKLQLLDTSIASDGSHFGLLDHSEPGLETSWQLHIYATRHNVHITVVRPPGWVHPQTGRRYPKAPHNNRTVALSLAAGNLGFRKSGRKHYDSAFQLASYVMGRMQESGMNAWIGSLEVYLRGFGAGREAVTKALLGTEGRYLRGKVIKVSDATRLKFGGTRSKKPRRLG